MTFDYKINMQRNFNNYLKLSSKLENKFKNFAHDKELRKSKLVNTKNEIENE